MRGWRRVGLGIGIQDIDFRLISVMPILSRLAEKLIVQKWLLPAVDHQTINDQFAFRPTGSTTSLRVPWYFYAPCY